MNQVTLWSESFKIHSYEVDVKGRATLEALCRYFQEAGWNHAEALGAGFTHLQEANKFWVLSRLMMKIDRLPLWGHSIKIETWPRATKSVFAMRDFEMFDSTGSRILAGSSAWLMLNSETRKPQRVDKLLAAIPALPDRRALPEEPERLLTAATNEKAAGWPVRWSDLDVNGHVNYARYLGWIVDAQTLEFHQAHAPAQVEINYLDETNLGEVISVSSNEIAPGQHVHSVWTETGKEVCRARIVWRPDRSESVARLNRK